MTGVRTALGEIFTIRHIFSLLLNDFTAIGGHLWFIAALLCCYGLFRHAGCKWLDKCGGSAAAILLGAHIVGRGVLAIMGVDSIGGIPAYLWLRNGAFMGLPFVALGDWIRRNQVRLTERLTKMNLIAMLIRVCLKNSLIRNFGRRCAISASSPLDLALLSLRVSTLN